MRNSSLIVVAMLLSAISIDAAAQRRPANAAPPETAEQSMNGFATDLYAQLAKGDGNLFFSPKSIQIGLAMAWAGANGRTADEMAKTLHLPVNADLAAQTKMRAFLDQLNTDGKAGGYDLSTANALWLQKGFPFTPAYLEVTKNYFSASPTLLDFFDDTEGSRKTINEWAADQTHGRIKDLLPQDSIDRRARIVLTNAIYFKGKWDRSFDKNLTEESDFRTTSGKKVKVPLMYQQSHFRYGEDNGVQVLELPYGNDQLCMRIFLPRQAFGLAALETRLTAQRLAVLASKLQDETVMLWLPRFKLERELVVNDTLKAMGMNLAFDARQADFSGMTDAGQIYITKVVQKAFVSVDEDGTEAAAATGVVGGLFGGSSGPRPPPREFRADHPFIFAIVHRKSDVMLFMGRVTTP